jgi:small subunit ribosomal protein S1
VYVSELADHKVDTPADIVKVGDEVEVKILRVDPGERKIALSHKCLDRAEEEETRPRRTREGLRGGTGASGQLIEIPEDV